MANVERTMENLKKRGFSVSRFPDGEKAAQYLLEQVGNAAVGIGGSMTVEEMGLFPGLLARGETYYHLHQTEAGIMEKANLAPIYIMSANGVSESGCIINIDGRGNRVANMCFGHEKLYFIIGTNKIAPTDEEAMWRARNIASPKNARRLNRSTPCAAGELKCHDCTSPARICRVFVTLEHAVTGIPHTEVIIVDEVLGY